MKVNDAEVVFLHIMLLWSVTSKLKIGFCILTFVQNIADNEHVTEDTRKVMKQRRDWAMNRLFDWYNEHGTSDPPLRFGQMILLLGEIEVRFYFPTLCNKFQFSTFSAHL